MSKIEAAPQAPLILASRSEDAYTVNILKPFKSKKHAAPMFVPVLVRFWPEDGVWNASALDIPVAVFGDSFEEARANFEEAIASHFEVLCETNRIGSTVKHLQKIAREREYYERIPARQAFEKFMINPKEPCLEHV